MVESMRAKMMVTNPVLAGKFKYGQKYYLDFTPSEQ